MNELRDTLEDRLEYPVNAKTVEGELGDVVIEAESDGEGTDIAELLDNHRNDEFSSANELHQTILGALPDEYIGRKYYDDRGTNPEGVDGTPEANSDESL